MRIFGKNSSIFLSLLAASIVVSPSVQANTRNNAIEEPYPYGQSGSKIPTITKEESELYTNVAAVVVGGAVGYATQLIFPRVFSLEREIPVTKTLTLTQKNKDSESTTTIKQNIKYSFSVSTIFPQSSPGLLAAAAGAYTAYALQTTWNTLQARGFWEWVSPTSLTLATGAYAVAFLRDQYVRNHGFVQFANEFSSSILKQSFMKSAEQLLKDDKVLCEILYFIHELDVFKEAFAESQDASGNAEAIYNKMTKNLDDKIEASIKNKGKFTINSAETTERSLKNIFSDNSKKIEFYKKYLEKFLSKEDGKIKELATSLEQGSKTFQDLWIPIAQSNSWKKLANFVNGVKLEFSYADNANMPVISSSSSLPSKSKELPEYKSYFDEIYKKVSSQEAPVIINVYLPLLATAVGTAAWYAANSATGGGLAMMDASFQAALMMGRAYLGF